MAIQCGHRDHSLVDAKKFIKILKEKGWKPCTAENGSIQRFEVLKEGKWFCVPVPVDKNIRFYDRYMRNAIEVAALAEAGTVGEALEKAENELYPKVS